jgi:predicted ArsR family transcriptional regulator
VGVELRNNVVVKFPGEAAERVARALLTHGPQTATELAAALGQTSAGVRRHLSALVELGLVSSSDRAPYGPAPKRGRGRPGSVFSLTDQGRAACGSSYDDLALSALRYLESQYGPDAVSDFAVQRARSLASAVAGEAECTPDELAEVLTAAGYAAEVQPMGDVAVQLCQHTCPVVDAAREFPVLCEAETAELSRVLHRHVTRLATLAHGDEVCTAVIPISRGLPEESPSRRAAREPSAQPAHSATRRKASA